MRILIVIIISVTLNAFQINQNNNQDSYITDTIHTVDIVNQIDLNSQIINTQVETSFKFNEIQQNHSQDTLQVSNNQELIHSVQYWLDKLDDDQLSQKSSSYNNTQLLQENQSNQSEQSTHSSRLAKYIQIQQIETQSNLQNSQSIQTNPPPQIEEKNPLKLLLLYTDNPKSQNYDNDDEHQTFITNEQILDQLDKEKQDKIVKMQSLIIEQLKDKKLEPKKEESFLEKDYIEWEMKTLISNNNLRAK
ncbi:unnamed protein product [Paramecium sonneborni]|uniref:Transmembrane protein n=1 Tax=Paramecium sonneborni TaxID=65129 RepID=A0A8S1R6V8_9CILI|nr:unnamed protein product [Paramecium sonneborni]